MQEVTLLSEPWVFPALIEGIDCRQISDQAIKELLHGLFRHRVLVMRNQTLSASEFACFMRRLGPTIPHVLDQFKVEGLADVIALSNLYDADGQPTGVHDGGNYWHTDMSYLDRRGVLTALYSVKVPNAGGETEFMDTAGALERWRQAIALGTVPLELARLDRSATTVKHRFGNRARLRDNDAKFQPLTEMQTKRLETEVEHPLIMRHPVVGTESLYGVAGTALGIDDLPRRDSCELLDALFEFMLKEAPRYAHRYSPGDLVIWDNASTLHRGTEIEQTRDPAGCRLLWRANVDYAAGLANN